MQPGRIITATAPAGGILSGSGMLAGSFFGVASHDAAEGEPVEIALTEIFTLPKAADAITFGAKVYWDDAAKKVTTTAAGNKLVGAATAPAIAGDAAVPVRLNGISI
ncbi:MAG: DUF2190 family protein [Bosea sp. (in: a-proteobacteria)]|nr:DUF2190 family protein [Bosea sp. (in: a-proteobacteria)]